MADRFKIAIVGSGPGGLSAAARAAERNESHVLLEAEPQLSNTIYLYQKGKYVMAEPSVLPLRSAMSFAAGILVSLVAPEPSAAAGYAALERRMHLGDR